MPTYSMVLMAALFAVIYLVVWMIEKIKYMTRKISDLEARVEQMEVTAEKKDFYYVKED